MPEAWADQGNSKGSGLVAVLFEGQAKGMINRHRFMGDGITVTFPEKFTIFVNTADKYTLQFNHDSDFKHIPVKTDYESFADAYIAAMVHIGKMELRDA